MLGQGKEGGDDTKPAYHPSRGGASDRRHPLERATTSRHSDHLRYDFWPQQFEFRSFEFRDHATVKLEVQKRKKDRIVATT